MSPPYRIFQPTTRILSSTSAPDLLHWVSATLDVGIRLLLIDLRYVMFMDSSGLGALVIARNRVDKQGGTLAVCSLSGQTRMLMETADVHTIVDIYDDPIDFQNSVLK